MLRLREISRELLHQCPSTWLYAYKILFSPMVNHNTGNGNPWEILHAVYAGAAAVLGRGRINADAGMVRASFTHPRVLYSPI
jgi:hypothetical protein